MRSGRVYERPTSAPRITGSASSSSSLLPTPVTQPETGNGHARNLGKEVRVLPTPTVGNATGTNERRGGARAHEKLLPGVVLEFLPTITALDADRERNNPAQANRKSPPISAVSQYFPTPRTTDANGPGRHGQGGQDLRTAIVELSGASTPPLFDAGSV